MCVVIHNGCAESLSAEYIVGVYVKKRSCHQWCSSIRDMRVCLLVLAAPYSCTQPPVSVNTQKTFISVTYKSSTHWNLLKIRCHTDKSAYMLCVSMIPLNAVIVTIFSADDEATLYIEEC